MNTGNIHTMMTKKRKASLGTFAKPALLALVLIAGGLAHAATEPSPTYTVRASDKLIRLSREMLVTPGAWLEVAAYNQLKDPNVIRPGQKIDIPLRLLKSQPAAGKLISSAGDVQIGGAAASTGAAVREGSRVQTGLNSSAVIELGDGSQVKLLPGTLAEVVTNRNYAMRDASASASTTWFSGLIRLAQGSLETLASKGQHRAEPLQIKTATSVIGVRGTQFRVAMNDPAGQNSRSEVIEGVVRADNPAQQSGADLPMGTGAVINPTQKEVKVVKLLPAPDLSASASELVKPQAELHWAAVAGAAGYRVQLASDAAFNQIVREYRVAGTSANLADAPSANWYARVRGIDGAGLEGFDAVKQLALSEPRLWRAANPRLSFLSGGTVLRWVSLTAVGGEEIAAQGYTIELARDRAFTQELKRIISPGSSAALGTLGAGSYFVRAQAMLDGGKTLASETYTFALPDNWGYSVFDATGILQPVR